MTGGSAVSIYSDGRYVSNDLDFVAIGGYARRAVIRKVMEAIGFRSTGRHFEHPEIELLVEFPGGPLSVGQQKASRIDTHKYETGS